jgi:hypothetical protein
MSAEVIAALIVAAGSLAAAIYGLSVGHSNQRELETLKDSLAEKRAEQDAWRDYQYEARKRLYEEWEPLFFQLREASEIARDRIYSLASRARQGRLGVSAPSLLEHEGHYAISTYYQLMVPLTIFRLLQRRLTVVDLNLDPVASARYELAKWLYVSFASDYVFADADPRIQYTPDSDGRQELRESNPHQFWRQGIPRARLDAITETLLVRDEEHGPRYMSYGEFESGYRDPDSELRDLWSPVADIFHIFHPATRPVLWRMLITQTYLYTAIIECSRPLDVERPLEVPRPVRWLSERERKELDWRVEGDNVSDEYVVEPFVVAKGILSSRLPDLCAM